MTLLMRNDTSSKRPAQPEEGGRRARDAGLNRPASAQPCVQGGSVGRVLWDDIPCAADTEFLLALVKERVI
ncbi:hypothetical protein EON67_09615, partial [archaeon]